MSTNSSSSNGVGQQQQIPPAYNPFTVNGLPKRGQPYILPKPSELPPLPEGPGFGCLVSPNTSLGFPLAPGQPCAPGFFCPYVVPGVVGKDMVACPATAECSASRLGAEKCLPQGIFEPVACLAGFYCPEPTVILPCPSGYQCVTGTYDPVPCQTLSYCPTGTSRVTIAQKYLQEKYGSSKSTKSEKPVLMAPAAAGHTDDDKTSDEKNLRDSEDTVQEKSTNADAIVATTTTTSSAIPISDST
ncbi:hypothetical protein HDU76_010828, partial [Blyttiomyces sp. JEL0837]